MFDGKKPMDIVISTTTRLILQIDQSFTSMKKQALDAMSR